MKKTSRLFGVAAGILALGFVVMPAEPASAAYIPVFNKTTNDGVFTLSAAQAAYLGTPTADRLGFFRVRQGSGTVLNAGDTFDAASITASIAGGAGNVLGIFNGIGPASNITYGGPSYDPLGLTTLVTGNDVYRGVAFAFSSLGGNIVFKGTSTFNGGQTQGPSPSPVPIPGAIWLFGAALAGLGVFGWKRRAAA